MNAGRSSLGKGLSFRGRRQRLKLHCLSTLAVCAEVFQVLSVNPVRGVQQIHGTCDNAHYFNTSDVGVQRLLSCHPAPVFKCLLANTPPSREIAKLAHMHTMMRESQGMFVVVEIQFCYLCTLITHRRSQ